MATYTVKKGDNLWNIAKKHLGSGSKWKDIYNANKGVIGSNPNLIYAGQKITIPGASGSSGSSSSSKPAEKAQPSTPKDIVGQIPKQENPYEKQLQQFLAARPEWKATSEDEMLRQAQQYAALQIDPQLQALQRSLEEASQYAEGQKGAVEAAYSGVPAMIERMLAQAREYGTEDAVARGVGRSGVVDYNIEQLSEPIMEQGTQIEAEKAAKLASIADALALAQRQAQQQQAQLEEQRGLIESNRLGDLRQLGHSMQAEDWERAWNAAQNLASMANQQYQFQQQAALNWAPYFMTSEQFRQQVPIDWAQVMGKVPTSIPKF
jgi:nucleoid-associated protein YgaU